MDPITDRQKSVADVLATHRRFARSNARALEDLVAPVLQAGKPMPDFVYLQQLLADSLDLRWRRLSEADEACHDAQAERHALIVVRDGEVALLYREVVDLRTIVRGRFGAAPSKNFIGLRGDTSRDPVLIQRQADRAVARLSDAGRNPPPSKLPPSFHSRASGATLAARRRWALPVAEAAGALRATVARVTTAAKVADAAGLERRRALAGFNDAFVLIAGLFEAIYRVIARPDLAEGVRPSKQYPGLTYKRGKRRPGRRARPATPRAPILRFPRLEPVLRFFGSRQKSL